MHQAGGEVSGWGVAQIDRQITLSGVDWQPDGPQAALTRRSSRFCDCICEAVKQVNQNVAIVLFESAEASQKL